MDRLRDVCEIAIASPSGLQLIDAYAPVAFASDSGGNCRTMFYLRLPARLRVLPIALTLVLAALVAGCAGEDNGDDVGITEGLSTPTTTLPTTTAPTTVVPTTTVPVTTTPASTPTSGSDASPTADAGGGATPVTLEDVQTYVQDSMPSVNVDDITAVDHAEGELTVETAWDSTMEADAQSLCDELLMMTTDPPLDSVVINGSDGSSLAECEAGG